MKTFIEEQLTNSVGELSARKTNESWLIKHHSQFYTELMNVTSWMKVDSSVSLRIYTIRNDISEYPKCPVCLKEMSLRRKYCGPSCSMKVNAKNIWNSQEKKDRANQARRSTLLKETGYEYNSQNPEKRKLIEQKREEKTRTKVSPDQYQKLNDIDWLKHQYVTLKRNSVDIAEELGVFYGTVLQRLKDGKVMIKGGSVSSTEEAQIRRYVESLNFSVIPNSKQIIKPYELDVFVSEKNLAIEYNGFPWHFEEKGKDRKYHLMKTEMCLEKNISLIHVFQHDWKHNRDKIQNLIAARLGVLRRLNGRDCEVGEISGREAIDFINANHLRRNSGAKHYIGLRHAGILVFCVSFSRHRYAKEEHHWELVRVCSQMGVSVHGSLSKCLKYFRSKYGDDPIQTYADRSWSEGAAYLSCGFVKLGSTSPNYWYWKDGVVYSRQSFMKGSLGEKFPGCDMSLDEGVIMKLNGYDRFWDCGSNKFILT